MKKTFITNITTATLIGASVLGTGITSTSVANATPAIDAIQTTSVSTKSSSIHDCQVVRNVLRSRGYSSTFIAGLAGNSWQVSRCDASAKSGGGHFGLLQWSGNRIDGLAGLRHFARGKKLSSTSPIAQAYFIDWQLAHYYPNIYRNRGKNYSARFWARHIYFEYLRGWNNSHANRSAYYADWFRSVL